MTTPSDGAPAMTPSSPSASRVSPWWRVLAIVLLLALLLGWAASESMVVQLKAQIAHLQGKVAVLPQVRHISVLLDDKQLPAMLITFDPGAGMLQVQRLNDVTEGPDDSMQIWALEGDKPARSLGLIVSKYKTLQLPMTAQAMAKVSQLAISVENKGGVSDGQGPRLPYLFKGWLVQKAI
jgi:anti-sigma-K factor RskA